MNVLKLAENIINGHRIKREDETNFFVAYNLNELCKGADIIRSKLCGDRIDLCSIINGRSGQCSENCKFCAQSIHNCTGIEEYGFLDGDKILEECKHNEKQGVHRFAIVTAGRSLCGNDFKKALSVYKQLKHECRVGLCASMGLLTLEQFKELYGAGVRRYHCNIETSKRNFHNICTTHTYEDKINCIQRAKSVGFEVCSGGIIGMGETWEDRIDMAISLSELGVKSIPINALIPIKGTSLENMERISENDILRTIAIFRYINPNADIRFAAGRNLVKDCGKQAFKSGANSAITGDMLTTSGNKINEDIKMFKDMGFLVEKVDINE